MSFFFFFCQASETPSDSVAWLWEQLPWSPEKQIGAVRLAQASVSRRLGGDTLWSYFVHIKHGYTAMYTAKYTASRGPSWCLCSLSLLLALGQVTCSRGKTGRGNRSMEPGGVLQEGSADQVGWWGAQMQRPRKGPRAAMARSTRSAEWCSCGGKQGAPQKSEMQDHHMTYQIQS